MPFKITDKRSGKSYNYPGKTAPDKEAARQFIYDQEHKSTWDKLNEPLTDLPSRMAHGMTSGPVGLDKLRRNTDNPWLAGGVGFAEGAIDSIGDMASGLTSPLSLGLTALTLGSGTATKLGLGSTAANLNTASRVAGAGLAGHGAYSMAKAKDLGQFGGGAAEFAGGLLGARGGHVAIPEEAVSSGASRRALGPKGPSSRFVAGEEGILDKAAPLTKGPIDGEIISPGKLGARPDQKALGRGKPIIYGGRRGISPDIEAVSEPIRYPRTAQEGAFNALVPDRYKPHPSNMADMPPYEFVGSSDQPSLGSGRLADIEAPISRSRGAVRSATTGLEKVSDRDVEFMAETGDKSALQEALKRPSLMDRFKKQIMDDKGSTNTDFLTGGMFSRGKSKLPDFEASSLSPAREVGVPAPKETEFRPGERITDLEGRDIAPPQRPDDPAYRSHRESSVGKHGDATAEFVAHQQDGTPLYNIKGGPKNGSTVGPEALRKMGIPAPETPPFSGKKEIPAPVLAFLKDRGVPDTTLSSYTPEQAIEAARKMKTEGGFIKLRSANNKGAKQAQYRPDFEDWVNQVHASKVEGRLKGMEFKDLDELGLDGIHAFQSGSRAGRLADVGKYFDAKHQELKNAGVRLNYRENYLPQIWADAPDKVKDVYRRLGLRPSFTLDRVFDDYTAGINAGLTPKFKNLSELTGWYEQKANKAIADRKFYELSKDKGWIKPQGRGGPDWQILDPNHFPSVRMKSRGSGEVRILPMTAPPELHELVSNYLGQPERHLQAVANLASTSKNLAMSAGVPYTAVNAHGFNILARSFMDNPKSAWQAGKWILNPKSAGEALESSLKTAPEAVRNGLTLTSEEHSMSSSGSTELGPRILQGILSKTGPMFEDPLFQKVIPALKLKHYNDMAGELIKGGAGRKAAGKAAAEFTNNLYGGINWEAMGRSRDLQNIARSFVLAPDWFESNVRLGKGMAKTLADPKSLQGHAYAKAARNIIGAYVAANVMNYTSSGKFMWENAPGHSLDIDTGKTSNDKTRWFRPFGTAADFLRLPFDAAAAAVKTSPSGKWQPNMGVGSEMLKNRLSTIASPAINLLTKRDRFGRPILGKDDFGRPLSAAKQIGGVAGELSGVITPPYVKGAIDYGTGRIGGEEAIMGGLESPLRYSAMPHSGSRSRSHRRQPQRR